MISLLNFDSLSENLFYKPFYYQFRRNNIPMYYLKRKKVDTKTCISDLKAKSKILVDFGWLQLFIRPVGPSGAGGKCPARLKSGLFRRAWITTCPLEFSNLPTTLFMVFLSGPSELGQVNCLFKRTWITTCPLEFSNLPTTLFMAFVDEDRPSGTPAVFQFTPLGHFCCFVVQLACTLCDVFDTISTVKIVIK